MGSWSSFRHEGHSQLTKSWGHLAICSVSFCSGRSGTDVHTEIHGCEDITERVENWVQMGVGIVLRQAMFLAIVKFM